MLLAVELAVSDGIHERLPGGRLEEQRAALAVNVGGPVGRRCPLAVPPMAVSPHLVITYDRRGLSRSRLDDLSRGATLAEHADDAALLLATVTSEPAAMLGCSLGAVIGLHLAVRHPGRIHTLIAHEPVAPRLLPAAERARHEHELADLRRLYIRSGLAAALPEIARVLGIDTSGRDAEPGLTPQPTSAPRRGTARRPQRQHQPPVRLHGESARPGGTPRTAYTLPIRAVKDPTGRPRGLPWRTVLNVMDLRRHWEAWARE
ncbi:alpha/beta fold hydrolase [Streptomyces asiaticus]